LKYAAPVVTHDPEQTWVRGGFGFAALIAVGGDVLFVRAGRGAGTATAWTAFFAAYLGVAAVAAAVAVVGRGTLRAVCGGAVAGAAIAFNLLALLSVGIFFLPLTVWVVAAAERVGRGAGRARPLILAAGGAAMAAPFLVFFAVHP
jgi:hypothetical protein